MDLNVEQIAKTCHEANRAYCRSNGDDSQPAWEDAPDWQKESAMDGVRNVIDHPDQTPASNHWNWMQKKISDGWKYGKKKDPDKKEHPCLVAYEQLPKEEKVKDELFLSIVRSFL